MGPNVARAPLQAILADAYLNARRAADGLTALEAATAEECLRGERYCLSELDRLRGDLLMVSGQAQFRSRAEACYIHALTIAQSQGARWFELLALMGLCRLRREGGARRQRAGVVGTLCVLHGRLEYADSLSCKTIGG